MKTMRDPGAPTQAQIDAHNVNHLPFRAWCPACVTGTAKDRPHHRDDGESKEVATMVFDYGFLGSEGTTETLPFQVMKHIQTGMLCANAVPRKGLMNMYGADELIEDIEKLGYSEIILKSDGEPALINIQNEVQRRREGKTILENSPVGDSRSNGHAERAVQSIAGHVRTIKKALEDRVGIKLNSDHPVIPWIILHSADILNKFSVGKDGKTAYERWKGKQWTKESVEFGELIHFKLPKNTSRGKLDDRWDEGIFLGMKCRTGEYFVSTGEEGSLQKMGWRQNWEN